MSRAIGLGFGLLFVAVILAGLFLPAIKSARQSAQSFRSSDTAAPAAAAPAWEETAKTVNRGASPSDLKQFGLALQNVHSSLLAVPGDAQPPTHSRKIVYSAAVNLVVEDFSNIPEEIGELTKKFDAYIADSNLRGSTGETRSGTWKIRVPMARFDEFLAAAKEIGELVNSTTSSKDVSEEFYDVEARIRNKTKEEERLLKLLEERPGKLEDIIAIERELSRVREELERMQGRMRVLADLTTLTTIELTITEIHGYRPEDAPTLATRSRRALDDSLSAMGSLGGNTVVAAVAILPWLPLILAIVGIAYVLLRRGRRKLASAITEPHS